MGVESCDPLALRRTGNRRYGADRGPAGAAGQCAGGIARSRNATLSANTGALPRNGFDSAIATFSWLKPG